MKAAIILIGVLIFVGGLYFFRSVKLNRSYRGQSAIERWESLSKEDRFYGMQYQSDGSLKRLEYKYQSKFRAELDHYPHVAISNFFATFSEPVYAFAERRNTRIEKYYHDGPVWMLFFYHPNGGLGRIDITYKYPDNSVFRGNEVSDLALLDAAPLVSISSMWTSPDFDRAKSNPDLVVEIASPIDEAALTAALEKNYSALLEMKE